MKKITLLLLLTTFSLFTFSQSLTFVHNDETIPNNSSIMESNVSYGVMDAHVAVKNQSNNPIEATLTVTILEEPIGGGIGYCGWGTTICDMVNFGTPLSRITTLNAGETIDPKVEALVDEGSDILIKVKYELSYNGEPSQNVYITYTNNPSSISASKNNSHINIVKYGGTIKCSYSFNNNTNRQLIIYDITGKSISSTVLTENKGDINLPTLPNGIYFYSVKECDRISVSQKFIIQ